MIPRSQAGTQRPPPPQRVPSNGPHRPLNRPVQPSKLSNVRTASQQGNAALHLSQNPGLQPTVGQTSVKQEPLSAQPEVIDLDEEEPLVKNEAASNNTKTYSANGHLADGQSPRSCDTATLPSTPTYQPKIPSLPFPSRPAFMTEQTKRQTKPTAASAKGRRDPSRMSSGLRPPAVATSLPRGKVADFFPWSGVPGAHPEDVLNELYVKNGNNDKGLGPGCPNINAESNTARPNLWPSLKNKSGMHILSALFCQVLDKRQQMGRCTAPSTFKPPPRVTLTDTKREAWLKDLSNPEVPLRRLSRTIPHGIRGKALMDHCITKNIPIARAVWLSKCVGANEIRAFKRKGVSGPAALAGEVKWIREWTICVEQFVEGIIEQCGQAGWSGKMNYAIRLATYFFSEHLLDAEHYIDWLITSIETTSTERLPLWVILIQVYWKHLVSQRQRGRRLTESLIGHARTLMVNGTAAQAPLLIRVQQLVAIIAVAYQGCLVMPKKWKDYELTYKTIACRDPHARNALCNVQKRNMRIIASDSSTETSPQNAKQALVETLDQAGLDDQIPTELLPTNDRSVLAGTSTLNIVIEWAISHYRRGPARMYLAARILRQWNILGHDTDDIILKALETSTADVGVDGESLYKIVSLLVRSGHFSVGKYLQWLISVGALSGIPTSSNDAKLLLELPTEHLPSHVSNLRRSMLNRLGYSVQNEVREVEDYKTYISSRLTAAAADSSSGHVAISQPMQPPPTPLGAVKLTIAQWLCNGVTTTHDTWFSANDRVFKGNLHVFCVTRRVLEDFEDFLSLSGCIKAASGSTTEAQFLATLADTINMHAEVFSAMGILEDLTTRLCRQQQQLRRRLPLDKTFLLALSSLVQRVPCADVTRNAVASDLQYCEMQSSAAACSPASDSMVMTSGGVPESDEDISRVLSSGNTMDEHLFSRMFSIIADRAIKTGLKNVSRNGGWFSQLRRFDPPTFDQLLQSLLNRMKEPSFPITTFVGVSAALVGSRCMKIDLPFRTFERHLGANKQPDVVDRFACICLELVLPSKEGLVVPDSAEMYEFRLEQKLFRERNTLDVLRILFLALENGAGSSLTSPDYAVDARALSFVCQYVTQSKELDAEKLFSNIGGPSDRTQIPRFLDRLMHPYGGAVDTTTSASQSIKRILGSANEFSLQPCKLALKQCFRLFSLSDDDRASLSSIFQESIEQDSPVWPELLSSLDEQLIGHIHSWSRDRAIASMSSFVSSAESSVKVEEIRRYLVAADMASVAAGAHAAQPQTFALLNEHLAAIIRLVDTISLLDAGTTSQLQRVRVGIDMLLQLITKQLRPVFEDQVSSPEIIAMTSTLSQLLIHQKLQNQRGALEYILDVTSIIIDDLSPEAMNTIVRNLPAYARNDVRIRYLFGVTFSPDAWLALASKIYSQPAPTTQQSQGSTLSSLPRPTTPLPPRPGAVPQRNPGNNQQQPQPQQKQTPAQRGPYEIKYHPFQIRRWEIMPDPTPNIGANDTSLGLGLFQARKVA